MIEGHKIAKRVKVEEFLEIMGQFKEDQIKTTDHTFFRLSQKQRKVFKDTVLKEYLLNEIPLLVGIQHNNAYAVFYKYQKNVLRITLEIQPTQINAITFYIIDKNQLPRI